MSNLPAKATTAAQRLDALARSASTITLIKYNSGNWTISDAPVPAETRFVIYPDQVQHSWTHFAGGKVLTEITAEVAEDEDGDIEQRIVKGQSRDDLGELDQATWETDSTGKARDPWNYGFCLPMMNADTGMVVIFKVSSVGGMGAIAQQVGHYNRNRHLGHPIVKLATGSYKNKKYGGYTSFPVFTNVGYDKRPAPVSNSGNGARVIGSSKANADMDDDIPF